MPVKLNDASIDEVTDVTEELLLMVVDPVTGDASYSTVKNARVADRIFLKVAGGGYIEVTADANGLVTQFLAVLP